MQIRKISKEMIPSAWGDIRELLIKPMIKCTTIDRFPLDYLLLSLITGEKQAWFIFNEEKNKIVASFVTEIVQYPMGLAINLFLLGGEGLGDWRDELTSAMFNYAQEIGAKWLDTYSRRGFWETLQPLGFVEESTHYSISI